MPAAVVEAASNGTFTSTVGDINTIAQGIWEFLQGQGKATRTEMREFVKGAGVSTPLFSKAFERLTKQTDLLTEVSEEDGTKAWTIKERARGASLTDLLELAGMVTAAPKAREKFEDWYEVRGRLVLTSPCLASVPVPGDPSRLVFHRSGGGVLLTSGYFRAMCEATCRKPMAPAIGNARYRLEWDQQIIPADGLTLTLTPVPPSRPGGQGQGLNSVETIPEGASIPFCVVAPGSHVPAPDMDALLALAGRWVGFSPAKAHLGFGRFRVEIDG